MSAVNEVYKTSWIERHAHEYLVASLSAMDHASDRQAMAEWAVDQAESLWDALEARGYIKRLAEHAAKDEAR